MKAAQDARREGPLERAGLGKITRNPAPRVVVRVPRSGLIPREKTIARALHQHKARVK
jgi:hypothetical protein